jgi:hypothetical protein
MVFMVFLSDLGMIWRKVLIFKFVQMMPIFSDLGVCATLIHLYTVLSMAAEPTREALLARIAELERPRTYRPWTQQPDDDYRTPTNKFGYRTFGDIMSHAERESENIRERNRGARADGRDYEINPYSNYPIEGIRSLGSIVGESVKGIGFKPEWSAQASAAEWLREKREKAQLAAAHARTPKEQAKTAKELEAWNRWGVVKGDFDNDKDTPDNTVLFSHEKAGKVRAIDGYYLKQPRWGTQNFYQDRPTKADRKVGDALKKDLKAYFRTYKTEAEQREHPFDTFAPTETAFNRVRAAVKSWLTSQGLTIYSTKKEPTIFKQRLHITHYMTLLQKLAARAYRDILRGIFSLPNDYDWDKDKSNVKGKKKQAIVHEYLDGKPDDEGLFTSIEKTSMIADAGTIKTEINEDAPIEQEKITGNFPDYEDGKAKLQKAKADAGKVYAPLKERDEAHFAYMSEMLGKKKASRGTRSGGVVSGSSSSSTGATEMPVEDE